MSRLIVSALLLMMFSAVGESADPPKHLFILSGQSNMAGLRPEESFIPTVEKEFGKDHVIVIKDAMGGQPIRRWDKKWNDRNKTDDQPIGDLYDRLMKKVHTASNSQKLKSVTFIWMQGERDAREKNADVYAESFNTVLAQLKNDLKQDELNFVIGRLSDFDMENKKYSQWTKLREVQENLADSSSRGAWVNTDDLNDGLNRRGKKIKNDLHYSAEGYKILGQRFADESIALIKKQK